MTDHDDVARKGRAPLDEFRGLVRAAFEQAQSSGKQNWDEMTSAVLKNRLLQMTDRQFSQARYGSPSFIHLVRSIPDLLDVLDDNPPFHLKLRIPLSDQSSLASSSTSPLPAQATDLVEVPEISDWRKVRIRDDLWRATVDYGSGTTYVLDPEIGVARPKEREDKDLSELPTVSVDEVHEWRQNFLNSLREPIKVRFGDELREWANGKGRQSDLPRPVRSLWVEYFKQHIAARLLDWFRERGGAPEDIFVESALQGPPPSGPIGEVMRTRQLRDLIIRAVRTMTYDEMSGIPLPASVLLRISANRKRHDS